MLCHRYNIGASYFSDGDTAICFICGIEVNVIRSNAGGNGDFEFLGLSKSFRGEVSWMKADDNG